MSTTSPDSSAPSQTPQITKLEAYQALHYPTVVKFYNISALARSALSLLDQVETQNDGTQDIDAARRVLFILDSMAQTASEEIDVAFADAERDSHG